MATAIFFDFDGTLVDVKNRFYNIYKTLCIQFGAEPLGKSFYWRARQERLSTHDILKMTKAENIYDNFIRGRTRMLEEREYLSSDTLRYGALETLDYLSRRHKLHLVSLRNSVDNLIWQLDVLRIRKYFRHIYTASAFGNYMDKYKILISANAEPYKDYIVGDTENDIEAGKMIGLTTCALCGGMRRTDYLASLNPDKLIFNLTDLHTIIRDNQ